MEKLKEFITKNPQYFGIFISLVGVVILIAAIKDAHWLFGDVNRVSYNLKTIDGWVNFFGRKTARIIAGVFSVGTIIAGVVWFWIYGWYYN